MLHNVDIHSTAKQQQHTRKHQQVPTMDHFRVRHVVQSIFNTSHAVQDVQVQHGERLHSDAGCSTLDALGLYARLDAAAEDGRQQAGACTLHSAKHGKITG